MFIFLYIAQGDFITQRGYFSYLKKLELLFILGFLLLVSGGCAVYLGYYPAYIFTVIGVIIIGYTFGKEKAIRNYLNNNVYLVLPPEKSEDTNCQH